MPRSSRPLSCILAIASCLLDAGPVAAQSLMLGPELAVDAPVDVVADGPGAQWLFDIGTGYLLVGTRGMAIRLNRDGSRLDLAPFPFADHPRDVACTTSQCLAVWTPGPGIPNPRMQRWTPDGTPLDPSPVDLSLSGVAPMVASAGDRYFVAWRANPDSDIYATHVLLDGTRVEAAPIHVPLPGNQSVYDVACDASACMIAYVDSTGGTTTFRAMRIARDGTVLDPGGIMLMSGSPTEARMIHQGTMWYVFTRGVASRISADGALLGSTSTFSSSPGGATCDAGGCIIGSLETGRPLFLHVALDGTFTRGFTLGEGAISAPVIACGATGCLAAYHGAAERVTTVEVSTMGTATAPARQPILRANTQRIPWITAGADDFLVAWQDARSTPAQVRAARMGPDGASSDSVVLTTGDTDTISNIRGGFGAGVHFISWVQGGLRARRVLADGSLPDASPISLGSISGRPYVAFAAGNFLFAWGRASVGLVGQRLTPAGATLEPTPFSIATAGADPAIASNGSEYLAIWSEVRTTRRSEIYGRRLRSDGTSPDALAFPVASADDDQWFGAIAEGAGQYLAVWRDDRDPTSAGIYGARIAVDGTVLDPLGIPIRPRMGCHVPHVAWDGDAFMVAWSEFERVEDPPGSGTLLDERYIALTGVGTDGALLASEPTRVRMATTAVADGPSIAALADGTTMLAYPRFDDTPGINAVRVFARVVRRGEPGAPCASADECASGACVGGICCDRACDGACEACTISDGAPMDGHCALRPSGAVCRPASGAPCDVDELCDGVAVSCPDDVPHPSCDPDAGGSLDGGTSSDAGTERDAAAPGLDASSTSDAGVAPVPSGCTCGVSGARPGFPGLALIALLAAVLWRRRSHQDVAFRPWTRSTGSNNART